jgi:methyl-accepting chemotaxis protein/methyl-accepting chemotaxis protein-1 (serine sensor receptor)
MTGQTKNSSMRTRLYLCFGLVLAATAANSAYSAASMRSLRTQMSKGLVESTAILDNARQVAIDIANMRSSMRGVTLFAQMRNEKLFEKARASFEAGASDMRSSVAQMDAADLSESDRSRVRAIRSAMEQWTQVFPQFASQCAAGNAEQADKFALQNITPIMDTLQQNAAELVRVSQAAKNAASQAAETTISRSVTLNVVFTGVMLLIGGGAFVVLMALIKDLKQITRSVAEAAREIGNASSHLASSSNALAQQSSQQAASIEETSASSEEINSMARKNTENSGAAADLVGQSQQKFHETNQSLQQMVLAMGEIKNSSSKISKIIKSIDEIAFQTNLLALNAAVEAARAGEAGQGFAVVADEVRNLAHRCAQAAQETAALIEESIAKSGDGKLKVDRVAAAIQAIIAEAGTVKGLVDEVSLGSRQQATGIEQIAKAITQMEQVTQQTAASAEESAAAAEELNAQSEALRGIVLHLTAMAGSALESAGGPSAGATHQRPRVSRPLPAAGKLDRSAFPLEV